MSTLATKQSKVNTSVEKSIDEILLELSQANYAIQMLKSTIPHEIIEAIQKHEETITAAKELLKEYVVNSGDSIKGNGFMVVFNKGKESWDSKGLNGYAVAHPEIICFKKVGNPYASIKEIK